MAELAPLNPKQVDVLGWIAAGTPERNWPDFTYKTTALALHTRRLAIVSKKGGTWTATITEAGKHYAHEGAYPAGHWPKRRASPHPKTNHPPHRPTALPTWRDLTTEPLLGPPAPTLTDLTYGLIDRVQRAGVLHIDTKREPSNYTALIAASTKSENLPDGKRLRLERTGNWMSSTIEISLDDDHWAQTPAAPVPVPQRVTKYHPAARAYLDNINAHAVSKASLKRAARILHALATEAERRGYTVTHEPAGTRNSSTDSNFTIHIPDSTYTIKIHEIAGRGAPRRPYPKYGSKPQPAWIQARQTEFIPTGKLEIDLGYSKHNRTRTYRDNTRTTLEEELPALLRELQARAREDTQDRAEQQQQRADRRAHWEKTKTEAMNKFAYAHTANVVEEQLVAWNHTNDLQRYITAMSQTIDAMPTGTERTNATQWLNWIELRRKHNDPLHGPLRMPAIPTPTNDDLRPYMHGLDPHHPPE